MKAFVTGAGGFIGSHLCETLLQKGYNIKALVHYNSSNDWGWLDDSSLRNEFEVVSGDIRDYDFIKNAMKGQDILFHLAALIGIPYSYITQNAYVETNIKGTLNILQAARNTEVSKIIHTSTSEVYGTAHFVPITENHPINPQSPYAATKSSADMLAMSFYYSFSTPVAIIRPFNVFGPRQSSRAVIPSIITQILSGKRRIKLGRITTTRDFTFVKDTVNGFINIAENYKSTGNVFNIGTGNERTIADAVKEIAQYLNTEIEIETDEQRIRPETSEVERLKACNDKAKEMLGWVPHFSFSEGICETIEWFKKNYSRYKPELYNV